MGTCKADPLLAGITPWAAIEQLGGVEDDAVVESSLQLITGFRGAGTAASSVITLLMPVTWSQRGPGKDGSLLLLQLHDFAVLSQRKRRRALTSSCSRGALQGFCFSGLSSASC